MPAGVALVSLTGVLTLLRFKPLNFLRFKPPIALGNVVTKACRGHRQGALSSNFFGPPPPLSSPSEWSD